MAITFSLKADLAVELSSTDVLRNNSMPKERAQLLFGSEHVEVIVLTKAAENVGKLG